MNELQKKEITILEIDVEKVKQSLDEIGANKVYDDMEAITTSDLMSKISIHRVSYRLGKVGIDIDTFPLIPSFLKINMEHLEEEEYNLKELLDKLNISHPQVVFMGIEDIYHFYGIESPNVYKVETSQENLEGNFKGTSK